jgi:hypothetical protein
MLEHVLIGKVRTLLPEHALARRKLTRSGLELR